MAAFVQINWVEWNEIGDFKIVATVCENYLALGGAEISGHFDDADFCPSRFGGIEVSVYSESDEHSISYIRSTVASWLSSEWYDLQNLTNEYQAIHRGTRSHLAIDRLNERAERSAMQAYVSVDANPGALS